MKGIILAGGTGSRLHPLTKTLNKHILPVYDRPMICWPLKTLTDNGIDDITIVSSPSGVGQIAGILGSGGRFNCKLTYRVQDEATGIAGALKDGMPRTDEPVAVILGDNVFLDSPILTFAKDGVTILLREFADRSKLTGFGVPVYAEGGTIFNIVEKPECPPSKFAVVGLYVFNLHGCSLPEIRCSHRGEFEITDVLNSYAKHGRLNDQIFDGEFWGDAGTIDGLYECSSACEKWVKSTR